MPELDKREVFPLTLAYDYLIQKGFDEQVNQIRISRDKFKSYDSSLRRGKIINLLESQNLLDNFILNKWPIGSTDKGQKEIRRCKRIFNGFLGSAQNEIEAEDEAVETTSFAYEEHLRDYLSNNLNLIEDGLQLFYNQEKKIDGIEYPIDSNNKKVDILALDKQGVPVIIELKVSRGYEKVIGQCLYYKNRVNCIFQGKKARIVIIAREITPELKLAVSGLEGVQLYEYKLQITLSRIL